MLDYEEMFKKASSLSHEERMHLCDMGYYNDIIKGYLIAAMQSTEFSPEEIRRALGGLRSAFDDTSAVEAAEIYHKYED